jgi:hypothetical protein
MESYKTSCFNKGIAFSFPMVDETSFLHDGQVDWTQGWTIAEFYLSHDPTHTNLDRLLEHGNLKELYLFGQEYLYTHDDPSLAMTYLQRVYDRLPKRSKEDHIALWTHVLEKPHRKETLQSALDVFLSTVDAESGLPLLFLCCESDWDPTWVGTLFQRYDMETVWSVPGCVSMVRYWTFWYRYLWNPEFLFPLVLPYLLQQDPDTHLAFIRTLMTPMRQIPSSPTLSSFLERVYTTLVTAPSQHTAQCTFQVLQDLVGRVDRNTKTGIVIVLTQSIPVLQVPGLMLLKKYAREIEWDGLTYLWERPLVTKEEGLENLEVLVHQLGVLKLCWKKWSREQQERVVDSVVQPVSAWTHCWLRTTQDPKTQTTLELLQWYYLADLHL